MHHPVVRRPALASLLLALIVGPLAAPAGADEPDPAPGPVATTLRLTAPAKVVDEKSATLAATWRTADGAPVVGGSLVFEQKSGTTWKAAGRRTSGDDGTARLEVAPRTDSVWRVRGAAGSSAGVAWRAATSGTAAIDNVPPGTPVRLDGPRPTRLAAQARASGAGVNAVVTTVPTSTWRSMVGRSWHQGCPVGRSGLRLLRFNYWAFDGYRRRGELVMSSAVVHRAAAALGDMYRADLPLRSVYRVDRFGWSKRLRGADDYKSMRADNTSAFNCRDVVNRPGVRSPHASGRAIDMNPWENPYRSRTGWVPNTYWVDRSHPRVAWRSLQHPVVKIWRDHGFRWTYGTGDSQHWDGRRAPRLQGSFVG
ncbi:M15 family metallopeptidase [Nocardioides marmoraquaticus]